MAVEFERVHEPLARFKATLDLERDDRTRATWRVLLATFVPRGRRQPGVDDAIDLVALLQPLGHLLRVRDVAFNAQRQRFEALGDQERIERGNRWPKVAQQLNPRFDDEREVANRSEERRVG